DRGRRRGVVEAGGEVRREELTGAERAYFDRAGHAQRNPIVPSRRSVLTHATADTSKESGDTSRREPPFTAAESPCIVHVLAAPPTPAPPAMSCAPHALAPRGKDPTARRPAEHQLRAVLFQALPHG